MEHADGSTKLPRNDRVVYDVVSAFGRREHAAAGKICAAARQRRAGIGYSAVYRALERPRELGLVLEVRGPGALCEASRASHPHSAADRCGCLQDVDDMLPAAELASISDRRHVMIEHVDVTFRGACNACREAPNAGDPAAACL